MRMESLTGIVLGACALLFTSQLARAEATRMTNPLALYLEMGGRGLGYGGGFDRVISEDLSAGVGFGMTPTEDANGDSANKKATVIPAYLNYYLNEDQGTLFLTVGMTFVATDVKGLQATYSGITFPQRSVLPTLGWGYENRGDSGFVFRLSGYGIWAQKIQPWVGFTFGYSF